MNAGARFQRWIEGLAEAWKERLRGWLAGVLGFGFEIFMDVLGKAAAPKLKPLINELEATGEIPASLQPLFEELKNPKGEFAAVMAQSMVGGAIGGTTSKLLDVLLARASYFLAAKLHPLKLGPSEIIQLWRRGYIKPDQIVPLMRNHGLDDDAIFQMQQLSEVIPYVQDIIRFAVREVYTPEIAEKFGQFEDFPTQAIPDAYRAGLSEDTLKKQWAAHWDLPSPSQGFEMLHRNVIDEDTLKQLLRALDVMPYWRDKLIAISWNVPTRVDVRRFWDMRTIDEKRLRELYGFMGYHGKDLDDYVLWTKVYVAFPDLMARWQNGWITQEEVESELTGLGMPADRVKEFIQAKVKATEAARVEEGKSLTKTEIYKGVKAEKITRDQAIELLMDLNYARAEAEYLLDINIEAAGSPESFADFKRLTTGYRIATGKEEKPMPQELKDAAAELVKMTKEVEELEAAVKEEEGKLIEEEPRAPEVEAKLKELKTALRRSRSALTKAQTDYNIRLAEWKHTQKP